MTAERSPVEGILESELLLDQLAAAEHERWAHWQQYVHQQCQVGPDGSLTIPAELADRWAKQISTPFAQLTDAEKDSDRDQVRRYLPIIAAAIRQADSE